MKQEATARKSVTLPASIWEAIDRFRFGEHIGTEAEALRRLLLAGLRSEGVGVVKKEECES